MESFRTGNNYFLLKFEGVNSIEEALDLVGAEVQVPEKELSPPRSGEFYLFKLVGCTVFSVEGFEVGVVEGVIPAAGNNLLQVIKDGKEILVPFTESICIEVNTFEKRIRIDPPKGLLDLNEV